MARGLRLSGADRRAGRPPDRPRREAYVTFDLIGPIAYASFFLVLALVNALVCLGLNVQWGQTGLFNVGVVGFVAIGAYASALLTTPPSQGRLGGFALPILVGWLAAMVASGAVSAFVGAVTLRLRADYLAITTFGVAVVVQLVALNAQGLTGGAFGVAFIPRPFDSLASTPALYDLANLALIAIVVVVVYVALERLARSPWGRVLRAIREDERAAMALGKNPVRYRLQAFALGGALMGLAGAIGAHFIGFIAPENYTSSLTFQVWAMLIVGGSGNNLGAIIGAGLVWALWSASGLIIADLVPASFEARAAALRIIAIGVLLATMIVVRPRGLIGEKAMVSRHLDKE
ncbi:MAG: branched-chain amino acid ABC transporter permease [Hyphomicrobiales bacterium]|nr:branched-chain amino acid ABC transporter permease [Hyphomicrobiales bacterium]